ncbi:MAG: respiratory nitrate reductase subunit gamma [Rhizobiaceae bacterium]|nr:respiratory nitrate reductase subunit gamma [Rhizobiaceae bacterium]
MLTIFYAVLFYVATLTFVGGLALRIYQYATTPAPLKIPTTPGPTTRTGVVFRMFREVAFFESLFKSNKWIWVFSALFHAGLLLVVLRHLRYFTQPVWFWVELIQPIGIYAGFAMLIGLIGLFIRRIVVAMVRYISSPSDYLMLLLLIFIGISGAMMKFVSPVDVVAVKQFFLGLMVFDWKPLPSDFPLLVHLSLVALLMIIFPFSKLLHAPGIFFSPTRYQVDNPREKRHIVAWAADLEK